MARIDDDIVAKAAFYAGLSQTLAPEELADDIRSNGNSLLKDVVESICADTSVDRGIIRKKMVVEDGKVIFRSIDRCVPAFVICKGEKMTLVGIEDFLTEYKDSHNVVCIYHSVEDAEERMPIGSHIAAKTEGVLSDVVNGGVFVDDNNRPIVTNDVFLRDMEDDVIIVETHLQDGEEIDIVCNRAISLDDTMGYFRVDCRKEVKAYIVDYTAYLMASMYQMSTKEDCAARMQLSLNHCKKVEVPHIMVADPFIGMRNMRGQSPLRKVSNDPSRGY